MQAQELRHGVVRDYDLAVQIAHEHRVGSVCDDQLGSERRRLARIASLYQVRAPPHPRRRSRRTLNTSRWLTRPIVVNVILPDVPDLVEEFTGILAPMVHDIELPTQQASTPTDRGGGSGLPWTDRDLGSVRDAALEVVSAVTTGGTFDVDPALSDLLAPILREMNLAESLWPRFAQAIDLLNKQRPFEQPILVRSVAPATAVAERPAPETRPMTPREHHNRIREQLTLASRWWAQIPAKQGGQRVDHFVAEIYKQAGIERLDDAPPDRLKRAVAAAVFRIRRYCEQSGTPLPRWARPEADDEQ